MDFGLGATVLGFERWGLPNVGVRKLTPTYGLYDGCMRFDGEDCEQCVIGGLM
jgi:hypothetical protein